MKIAVPTRDSVVDNHFGHCACYTIYEIADNKIVAQSTLPSPGGCGCKSNIASVLHDMGVSVMLAGDMGDGALNKLNASGIKVVRGCSGNTADVVRSYLAGFILDSGISCSAHAGGHVCSH